MAPRGRPPGSKNKSTIAQEQIAEGRAVKKRSPLDVMLRRMDYHMDEAEKALSGQHEAEAAGLRDEEEKCAREVTRQLNLAHEAAKDAAPYQHARLASVEHSGKGGGPIEYTNARERLKSLVLSQAAAKDDRKGVGKPH